MYLFTFGLLGKTHGMAVAYFKALYRHLLTKAAISTIKLDSLQAESQTRSHPKKRQMC